MPISNAGARVIDPVLTTVAQGYTSPAFVGNVLFPRVSVSTRGGQIIEFDRDAYRAYATKRSPGGRTARIQFGYSGKPFALLNEAVEIPLPREHIQDASIVPRIDLGVRAINVGMRNLALSLEIEQSALAFNQANYAAANKSAVLTGGTKWSTATGVPMTDVDAGREAVRQSCGAYPNVMMMSAPAFNACKNNPNVVGRFQYNGAAGTDASQITPKMLAGLFNVDQVVVGAGIYWSDANVAIDIWGNAVVLAYVPTGSMSLEEPSYGYTYTLDGNPLIETPYWEPQSKSWIYGATYERVPVLSGISSGYIIQTPA